MKNIRILLADRNRYHALLVEGEIHKRLPEAVVVSVRRADQALLELRRNEYAATVMDGEFDVSSYRALRDQIREIVSGLPIVLTVPSDAVMPDQPTRDDGLTVFVAKDSTFHILIGQLIEQVVREGTFQSQSEHVRLRLGSRRKVDMLNLTANTLAHEINNPLMAILGMSELLLSDRSSLDSDITSKVRIIQDCARRIAESLDQLGSASGVTFRSTAGGSLIDAERTDSQSKN